MPGFSSGMMGAMTLLGNITGAAIGFFFPVSKTDNKLFCSMSLLGCIMFLKGVLKPLKIYSSSVKVTFLACVKFELQN